MTTPIGRGFLCYIKDRKVRIELGSGYSKVHDQRVADVIKNDILPYFKQGQYSRGIYEGTQGVIKCVSTEVSWWEYYKWHMVIWALLIILGIVAFSLFRSGKSGWGWAVLALIGGLLLLLWSLSSSNKGDGDNFGGGKSSGGGSSGEW